MNARLVDCGEPCTLAECPPGPFRSMDGVLGFKTEYGAMEAVVFDPPGPKIHWTVGCGPDAYVLDSGEVWWGGHETKAGRDAALVQPLSVLFG